MSDAEEKPLVFEAVGLLALVATLVVAVGLGIWSFTSVLVGFPDFLLRGVSVVGEVTFPLVLASGILGVVVAVGLMLSWLYVASSAYERVERLFR